MPSNSAATASVASNGLSKRWHSEDSESDHNFNPSVPVIEKNPPAHPNTVTKPPQASTTSASSSDSESESSGSSDEEKKSKKNDNDNLDTFSLTNFLKKAKNQSPAPQVPALSERSPEDDISDLLSQKRSPFPDNLISGAAANPLLELSRPLSPLKGSPPPISRSKNRRRRTHKKSSSSAMGK